MKNARTNTSTAHQLTLLPDLAPAPNVSARFLLSHDTRELGMRQVAEIRHMLAERKAARPHRPRCLSRLTWRPSADELQACRVS